MELDTHNEKRLYVHHTIYIFFPQKVWKCILFCPPTAPDIKYIDSFRHLTLLVQSIGLGKWRERERESISQLLSRTKTLAPFSWILCWPQFYELFSSHFTNVLCFSNDFTSLLWNFTFLYHVDVIGVLRTFLCYLVGMCVSVPQFSLCSLNFFWRDYLGVLGVLEILLLNVLYHLIYFPFPIWRVFDFPYSTVVENFHPYLPFVFGK